MRFPGVLLLLVAVLLSACLGEDAPESTRCHEATNDETGRACQVPNSPSAMVLGGCRMVPATGYTDATRVDASLPAGYTAHAVILAPGLPLEPLGGVQVDHLRCESSVTRSNASQGPVEWLFVQAVVTPETAMKDPERVDLYLFQAYSTDANAADHLSRQGFPVALATIEETSVPTGIAFTASAPGLPTVRLELSEGPKGSSPVLSTPRRIHHVSDDGPIWLDVDAQYSVRSRIFEAASASSTGEPLRSWYEPQPDQPLVATYVDVDGDMTFSPGRPVR